MKNNTSLKITIARWLTPNGTAIDKEGIKPNTEVKRIYDEKNPKSDNQMDKAIQTVKSI
jgi:carboxyl-terminal processing protease